ncbi:MAG: Mitochondrial inner membrane protein [Candidatus Tokpelaia sp. JSC189]|nr:MAG: Mitochondrial inner membrane protein [Candidatus Tokpelaia sp. JSC189]
MGKSAKSCHLNTARKVAAMEHEATEEVTSVGKAIEIEENSTVFGEDVLMKPDTAEPVACVKKKFGLGYSSIVIAGITGGIIALGGGVVFQHAGIFSSFAVDANRIEFSNASIKNQLLELKEKLASIPSMPSDVAMREKERALLSEAEQNAAQAVLADVQNQVRFVIDAIAKTRKELSDIPNQTAFNQLQETISQRISALEAKLNELDKLKQDMVSEKSVTQNHEIQLEALRKGMASLVEQKWISTTGVTLFVAASALKSAVDRGGAYANELQTFSTVAPPNTSLNLLKTYADNGLPSAAELSARFSRVADKIAQEENRPSDNAGIVEKLWADMRGMVLARPVGIVDGNTPGAVAARMEVAIAAGDYARAINEWKTLPPRVQSVSADFMEILQARYEVDSLLSRFIFKALSPH